jgi:DNA-directed RNA polymerase subunit N (RpoN/RPB10)
MPLEAILCTCGKNVGSHIDLYNFCAEKIKRDFRRANMPDVTADRTQWDSKWTLELGALLDILHIDRECCRVTMLCKVKVADLR